MSCAPPRQGVGRPSLSALVFETGSLSESRVHWLGWTGWPASFWGSTHPWVIDVHAMT